MHHVRWQNECRGMLNTPWCSKPRLTLLLYGVLLLQFAFLHVKGKSGLKHTPQLLECWRGRPDLPTLTVTGRFSWNEVKESVNAPNIVLYPKVGSLGRFLLAAGFEWLPTPFPPFFGWAAWNSKYNIKCLVSQWAALHHWLSHQISRTFASCSS